MLSNHILQKSKNSLFAHISIMIHYDIIHQITEKVKQLVIKKTRNNPRIFVIRDDFFAHFDKLREK